MLTEDNHAKIGDFGLAVEKNSRRGVAAGTPIYKPPEDYDKVRRGEKFHDVSTSFDIWSLGGIYADIFHGTRSKWNRFVNEQIDTQWMITEQSFEIRKEQMFPKRKDETHPDYIIDQCLQFKPENRPSIEKVVAMLEKIDLNKVR